MRDKKEICKEIKTDVENGVYKQFPVVKERLTYICNKLYNGIYLINYGNKLSRNEIRDLALYGYIEPEDVNEFFENQ